jgi:hypothetical protein
LSNNTKYKIQNTKYKIQNTKYKIIVATNKIPTIYKMFIIQSITIFFGLLILFAFIRNLTKPTIIEGATGEYQNDSDDPLILAKKNAANIEVLKKQIDEISDLANTVKTNTGSIDKNSQSITSLMSSMSPSSNKDSQKNQALIDEEPETFNM